MNKKRLWHTLRLWMIPSGTKRAEYLRKNKVLHSVGKNCLFMDRKVPLYPNLISLHDNVYIASNVTFATHDATHRMLNEMCGEKRFTETLGCIEIMDNVFVGTNVTIMNGVRIGPNAIVAAGAVITKDVPPNSVVAGVPAKVIGTLEDHMEKRLCQDTYSEKIKPVKQEVGQELETWCWERFVSKRER